MKKTIIHAIKKVKGKHGGVRYSTKPRCGAETNKEFNGGRPCQKRAGSGTAHPGIGRCKLHGGNNRIKHGLYSKVMPKKYLESYQEAVDNPQDMLDHIAVINGFILPEAIRQASSKPKQGMPHPLEIPMMAIDIMSKVQKRKADTDDRGKIKMTKEELFGFVGQIIQEVAACGVDEPTMRRLAERFGVRAMAARLANS